MRLEDSESQSGYMFTFNNTAVNWKGYKLETIVDSIVEA